MIGIGGRQKEGKEVAIHVSLSLPKVLSKDECRELIVECVEQYLKDINADTDLKQYLSQSPFTYNNLRIIIFMTRSNGSDIPYPDICIVSLDKGFVIYDAHDPDDINRYKSTEESYEEALKMVQDKK